MMGIPVVNYRPSRGNDKMTRVHSASPVFESDLFGLQIICSQKKLLKNVHLFLLENTMIM